MNNLLKEAIADAKAVRETALANAKLALEEAFTPRLQSMLSAKLSEDMEDMEEDEMPMDAADDTPDMEIEVPTDTDEGMRGLKDADEDPSDMHSEMRGMNDADEDPSDVHSEMRGMNDADEDPSDVHSEAHDDEMEEDLELEAILRELEEEEDKEETNEVSDSSEIGKGDNKVDIAYGKDQDDPGKGKLKEEEDKDKTDEEVDLDEIIQALREEDEDTKDEGMRGDKDTDEGMRGDKEKDEAYTAGVDDGSAAKELAEAYSVIKFMKSKLNEVNLLNAKLLFSNKLFRNHSLNESQKMTVIENFDRAQSLREVKLVFATLTESFKLNGGKKVKTIKESYASKATRSTKPTKAVLTEGAQVANRFKKLAGLI